MKKTYKAVENRPAIDLYLCTVYPREYTPEMKFNYEKLQSVPNLNLHFLGVEAGYFSHRHPKGVPDPVQIKWRDEYLKNVPVGSWLLVLDSDETIGGAVERIPDILYLMQENDVDYGAIAEIRSDLELKIRPRFIYKRRENMSYGGPTQRHDVIWTCHCQTYHNYDSNDVCLNGYNFIDVEAKERSWILDFLYFNHFKSGFGMSIFGLNDKHKIPENLATLEDLQ